MRRVKAGAPATRTALENVAQIDLYSGDALAFQRLQASWPDVRRSMLLRVQAIRVGVLEQRVRCAVAAMVPGQARDTLLGEAERDLARLAQEDHGWATSVTPMLRASIAAARGDAARAKHHLRAAVTAFDDARMALHAASARWYLGQLERDPSLIERARAWMSEQSMADQRKMARTVGSGFSQIYRDTPL